MEASEASVVTVAVGLAADWVAADSVEVLGAAESEAG